MNMSGSRSSHLTLGKINRYRLHSTRGHILEISGSILDIKTRYMTVPPRGYTRVLYDTSYVTTIYHGYPQALSKTISLTYHTISCFPSGPLQNKLYDYTISWFPSGPPQNISYVTPLSHGYP